jgi:methylated-DNA-[protein]-cysteine S-methyltransferase
MIRQKNLSPYQISLRDALLRQVGLIPEGRVSTYKLLTDSLGLKCYRLAGTLLGHNSELIKIPCHRIILSSGKVGDYAKGIEEKIRLLKAEGITFNGEKVENLKNILFRFPAEYFEYSGSNL